MQSKIKLKINDYTDRQNVIIALANSGYKVWVEEKELYDKYGYDNGTDYFVCIEDKRANMY